MGARAYTSGLRLKMHVCKGDDARRRGSGKTHEGEKNLKTQKQAIPCGFRETRTALGLAFLSPHQIEGSPSGELFHYFYPPLLLARLAECIFDEYRALGSNDAVYEPAVLRSDFCALPFSITPLPVFLSALSRISARYPFAYTCHFSPGHLLSFGFPRSYDIR